MDDMKQTVHIQYIQNRIFTFRAVQVMLDRDLAEMYGVSTKRLNEQVKRNIERFPKEFRFQLTQEEYEILRSQNATIEYEYQSLRSQNVTLEENNKRGKHRKYLPYTFTEQGVAMLSSVLRSETAVKVSIQIMQAFVEMRKFIANNATIFQRLEKVELKQIETNEKFEQLFKALEDKSLKPKQGIFYDGQVFDAYTFVTDLIRTAKQSIILIDNYVDDTVLTLLTKRKKSIVATIYTKKISTQLALDLQKHKAQYSMIEIKEFKNAHDRFLIIDKKTIYHFGASLKDLGKKWFAFSKMDMQAVDMLNRLNERGQ